MSAKVASRAAALSASAPAISRRRDRRSAIRPAGMANSTNGRVSTVCSRPVWPSPAPSASTATIGAAASATCSADCAARLDQARRLKLEGIIAESLVLGRRTLGSLDLALYPRAAGYCYKAGMEPLTSGRIRLRRWRDED